MRRLTTSLHWFGLFNDVFDFWKLASLPGVGAVIGFAFDPTGAVIGAGIGVGGIVLVQIAILAIDRLWPWPQLTATLNPRWRARSVDGRLALINFGVDLEGRNPGKHDERITRTYCEIRRNWWSRWHRVEFDPSVDDNFERVTGQKGLRADNWLLEAASAPTKVGAIFHGDWPTSEGMQARVGDLLDVRVVSELGSPRRTIRSNRLARIEVETNQR